MKLLSPQNAKNEKKKENEDLVDMNIRLREYYQRIVEKLNGVKDDYSQDKLERLKDFEKFCIEIQGKKDILLRELKGIEEHIKQRKDVYYGLIAKQDALDEREHTARAHEENLKLREEFVKELERKQRELIT